MEPIKALEELLKTFPGWDTAFLLIDSTAPQGINCGLFPQGMEVISCREDVTGKKQFRLRQKFILRRVCPRGRDSSGWLLALQSWLTGKALPALGQNCILRAEQGHLAKAHQSGSDVYQMVITADYTKENENED